MRLFIPVAKSGLSTLAQLPHDAEVIVCDTSRLDQRPVMFWSEPRHIAYDEIVIVERHAATALTQMHVADALRERGIGGPIVFAAQKPHGDIGYHHQTYLVGDAALIEKPTVAPEQLDQRYLLAIVGLPATGKSMLRYLFSQMPQFSTYKWSSHLLACLVKHYGERAIEPDHIFDRVVQFLHEVESHDRVVVARQFLSSGVWDDPAPFVVLDGVKSREQLIYTSYALRRPVIVVHVTLDEHARLESAARRGDFDDCRDQERLALLRQMGVFDLMAFADFQVTTTGCLTTFDEKEMTVRWTRRFVDDMHRILSWILVSSSVDETRQILAEASTAVAASRGYTAQVEVLP